MHKEVNLRRLILEVKPTYVVPDTNTFIDHISSLRTILESKKFFILVPTTGFDFCLNLPANI